MVKVKKKNPNFTSCCKTSKFIAAYVYFYYYSNTPHAHFEVDWSENALIYTDFSKAYFTVRNSDDKTGM